MASRGKRGAIVGALALIACFVGWAAWSQVRPAGQASAPAPARDPGYTLGKVEERNDKIDCMGMLARCGERAKACETQRAHCEASEAMLREELHAAFAELADLRPKKSRAAHVQQSQGLDPHGVSDGALLSLRVRRYAVFVHATVQFET